MVASFVERLAKASFGELQAHVDEVLSEMSPSRIVSWSEASPVDIDALRMEAKTPEAKELFATAYTEYTRAHKGYLELCRSLGVPGTVQDNAGALMARTIISKFHIVQSLLRKLRQGESHASVCAAAKKAVTSDIPASLMLPFLDGAASAREVGAESIAAESVGGE